MAQLTSTPEFYQLLADRFKALSEPARVQLLHTLEQGEMAVTELVEATGLGQANVSKHLSILKSAGLVESRTDKQSRLYRVTDPVVNSVCDSVCSSIERRFGKRATKRE